MFRPSAGLHPTQRQIAVAANVSIATISLALRDHPSISRETRRRIQTLALQMGYRPSPSVAALMSRIRTARPVHYRETLAWIHDLNRDDLSGMGYIRDLWQGAYARASQLGYELESLWLKEAGMSCRRMNSILGTRHIQGLLISPLTHSCGHLSLDWSRFAAVALSYSVARPCLHRVLPHHHHNIQLILRTLKRRGYSRIGLLLPLRFDERVNNHNRSAFYFYQQTIPNRDRVPVLVCHPPSGKQCALWLKKHQPDAVVTHWNFRHLREIDVGDPTYSKNLGVALLGIDAAESDFAGVNENPAQIGAAALDHVVAQLNRNERGIPKCPETVLIDGEWTDGTSLVSPDRRANNLSIH